MIRLLESSVPAWTLVLVVVLFVAYEFARAYWLSAAADIHRLWMEHAAEQTKAHSTTIGVMSALASKDGGGEAH